MASRGPAVPLNGAPAQNPVHIINPPYNGAPPPGRSRISTDNLARLTDKNTDYSDDEDDEEEEEGPENDVPGEKLSSIKITIKCPLFIKGDGNLVAIDTAASANKIATGVVGALRSMSMSGHGVPMIDEEGRPRPITVTAIAEVNIEGSKNVVGDNVRPMLPKLGLKAARDNRQGANIKRERESSEEVEPEAAPKRTRLE